jgi:asparagine synthase (glutamine-hydrolysing)
MCGIVGFCDFSSSLTEEILSKMTRSLAHRGPDAEGIFFEKKEKYILGFGHRRLSILDLSDRGKQPFFRDNLTIVFNGEIYNFREIRNELIKNGFSFQTETDTEVILVAYKMWGMESINRFIGMFAYTLYDHNKSILYMVKDRVGVKPLYYYYDQKVLLFASELKAFHQNPLFKKDIDINALSLYLKYNYIPTPYSIFKNTHKVRPGHYLKFSLHSKNLEEIKYWDVVDAYNRPKLSIPYEEAVTEMDQILTKAFNYRMVADVPVGVFLSGGYDSSAVAAILQKDRTDKLKTFTIGFHEQKFNEATEARKIANYLGTDHTEYFCTAKDALEVFHHLPHVYDEPFADNSVVPTILVSQLARKSVTVALSGDGGDEIFAGYNKFKQAVSYTENMPAALQTLMAAGMKAIKPSQIPYFRNTYNFSSRYEKMQKIWETHSPYLALKYISHYITENETRAILKPACSDPETYFDIEQLLNTENDSLNKLLAIDYKTFLLDNNLVKIDRASMSVGLEGREPFLDQHIIEFVSRLPSNYKIRNGVTKSLLKSVVHKYIDPKLMDRPKMPFIAPLTVWFKDEMKELLFDLLNEANLKSQNLFNEKEIISWRDQYLNGNGISHQKIWNILLFQLWYNKWMK